MKWSHTAAYLTAFTIGVMFIDAVLLGGSLTFILWIPVLAIVGYLFALIGIPAIIVAVIFVLCLPLLPIIVPMYIVYKILE